MDERNIRFITAVGRVSSQPLLFSAQSGFNSSEIGVIRAMMQIVAEEPGTELFALKEINNRLNYTRPNLSQAINKLEDKGFIERVILKNDRRVTYVKLTEYGIKTLTDKINSIFKRLDKISEIMGREDTDRLIELTLRFMDAYDKTEEKS